MPEMRWVRHFHDHAGYIDALKRSVLDHWTRFGRLEKGDRLVISFHGVPKRTLDLGDPYHCECQKTGRLLAESLGLDDGEYVVTFQSRFGRAEWLQPYTAQTLRELAAKGCARVDVICPGFATDCLETLEEIAIEGKNEFLSAGGKQFHYIACLNDAPAFIAALADLAATADARLANGLDIAAGCRSAPGRRTKKPRTGAAVGCKELTRSVDAYDRADRSVSAPPFTRTISPTLNAAAFAGSCAASRPASEFQPRRTLRHGEPPPRFRIPSTNKRRLFRVAGWDAHAS